MDRKIETPGKVCGIIFGLFFTFIFGGGLGLCIKTEGMSFVFGLLLGILGFLGMSFAPIITKIVFKKQKEKYGEEILTLLINPWEDKVSDGSPFSCQLAGNERIAKGGRSDGFSRNLKKNYTLTKH